ncbi:MAG: hypothetical protein KDK35_21495 [Leptospiraceae bacterium]|nr:hypothetical protein [Leptospiraceae bacterium]MCP5486001.1 hypothetical protein [Spirochaetales bacterium]
MNLRGGLIVFALVVCCSPEQNQAPTELPGSRQWMESGVRIIRDQGTYFMEESGRNPVDYIRQEALPFVRGLQNNISNGEYEVFYERLDPASREDLDRVLGAADYPVGHSGLREALQKADYRIPFVDLMRCLDVFEPEQLLWDFGFRATRDEFFGYRVFLFDYRNQKDPTQIASYIINRRDEDLFLQDVLRTDPMLPRFPRCDDLP